MALCSVQTCTNRRSILHHHSVSETDGRTIFRDSRDPSFLLTKTRFAWLSPPKNWNFPLKGMVTEWYDSSPPPRFQEDHRCHQDREAKEGACTRRKHSTQMMLPPIGTADAACLPRISMMHEKVPFCQGKSMISSRTTNQPWHWIRFQEKIAFPCAVLLCSHDARCHFCSTRGSNRQIYYCSGNARCSLSFPTMIHFRHAPYLIEILIRRVGDADGKSLDIHGSTS